MDALWSHVFTFGPSAVYLYFQARAIVDWRGGWRAFALILASVELFWAVIVVTGHPQILYFSLNIASLGGMMILGLAGFLRHVVETVR